MPEIVKVYPPLAVITKLKVNIGGVPPFSLTISVGTITVRQAKIVFGGDEQPVCDKPVFEVVVSENVYFMIGQLVLSLVVICELSMTAFELPLEPNKVFKNVKSVISPLP